MLKIQRCFKEAIQVLFASVIIDISNFVTVPVQQHSFPESGQDVNAYSRVTDGV